MTGFSEWATRHCTIFGLFDPKHTAMVAAWQAVFDACGFTALELGEATGFLAAHAPPEFPSQHLGALTGRVRFRRAAAARSAADQADDVPRCALCGGGGLASVPDLAGVVNGEWVGVRAGGGAYHRTYVVTCSCHKGRTTAPLRRDGTPLTASLATYEQANPHWRAQVAQLHHERLAEARADLAHASGPLAELMRALLARAEAARRRRPGEGRDGEEAA